MRKKNQILLLDAFKIAKDYCPNISLVIYGKGPMKDFLLNYAENQEIDNVKFIDRSNNMPETYNTYDAFVLSSNFEGMPNALIEAMAVGLPCISTNCDTGPSDLIVNGDNGILVGTNNTDSLVDAIIYFYRDCKSVNEMGRKAKTTIALEHSKNTIIDKFYKLIINNS